MAISPNYLPIDLTSDQWTIERHLLTAQAAMINSITQAINGMLVLDEVLNLIALQLVEDLQVSGCLILPANEEQPKATSLVSVSIPQPDAWFSKAKILEEFRRASEKLTFLPGIGLPGRVWVSQQAEWRRDVSAESNEIYLRAEIARRVGLKAGLGIPLLTPNGFRAASCHG